ncbi:P-loop containing nucleoside triphosphate hydrolase protein [Xylariomycetidae sp. FL0641]|nr:P-loop containing nucleoside triphosphate hydrolase protein [Xylariomycetidae sp. FL0641]
MSESSTEVRLTAIERGLKAHMDQFSKFAASQRTPTEKTMTAATAILASHMQNFENSLDRLRDTLQNVADGTTSGTIDSFLTGVREDISLGLQTFTRRWSTEFSYNQVAHEELSEGFADVTSKLVGQIDDFGDHIKSFAACNEKMGSQIMLLQQKNTSLQAVAPVAPAVTGSNEELLQTVAPAAPSVTGSNEEELDALRDLLAAVQYERDQLLAENSSTKAKLAKSDQSFERMMKAKNEADEAVLEAECRNHDLTRAKLRKLFQQFADFKGNIRVMCRIRPAAADTPPEELVKIGPRLSGDFSEEWAKLRIMVDRKNAMGTTVSDAKMFDFERVFGPEASNSDVFDEIQDLALSAVEGKPVSMFTYGQTGSGKTHTMMSPDGMVPRTVKLLFERADEDPKRCAISIEVSIIEIYLDQIYDFLQESQNGEKTSIRLDEAQFVSLGDPQTAYDLIQLAMDSRTTSSTVMNDSSSRSHLVIRFRIRKETLAGRDTGNVTVGTLHLVDLAGSERSAAMGSEGVSLDEGKSINLSLSNLNRGITALGQGKPVPFETPLLRALRPAFVAGSRTLMFVCISPLKENLTTTLQTLEKGADATKARLVSMGAQDRKAATTNSPASSLPVPSRATTLTPTTTSTPIRVRPMSTVSSSQSTTPNSGSSRVAGMTKSSSSGRGSVGPPASRFQRKPPTNK